MICGFILLMVKVAGAMLALVAFCYLIALLLSAAYDWFDFSLWRRRMRRRARNRYP